MISKLALLWVCVVVIPASSTAQERLILIGGGSRPSEALARFVGWAGKERARILVIAWATSEPQAGFDALAMDFARFRPAVVEMAPPAPLTGLAKTKFMRQLRNDTGVFFTGRDQVRIMNVLNDESLAEALRERYRAGAVFGGTSAGTAIMSRRMITGEGDFTVIDGKKVETRKGLGLLPDDVIVDQHFIKRQRENRLFGLILQDPRSLGIGIDEGTALIVTDNRCGEVVGTSQVMIINARAGALIAYLLKPGEKFDLIRRVPEKHAVLRKTG